MACSSAAGDYAAAAALWDRVIRGSPTKWAWLRFERASVLAQLKRWDEAVAELEALNVELDRRASERVVPYYASREAVYYAIGMLHLARNDAAAARSAFGRALTENLGYPPAHATLGDLALALGNPPAAVAELAQAVDLAPDDVWFRFRLGVALLAAGRADSAVTLLTDLNHLEPRFADAYVELGRAREVQGDRASALAAYREYINRAPRRETARIEWVQQRIAALGP